jgi:hypothetical protein
MDFRCEANGEGIRPCPSRISAKKAEAVVKRVERRRLECANARSRPPCVECAHASSAVET